MIQSRQADSVSYICSHIHSVFQTHQWSSLSPTDQPFEMSSGKKEKGRSEENNGQLGPLRHDSLVRTSHAVTSTCRGSWTFLCPIILTVEKQSLNLFSLVTFILKPINICVLTIWHIIMECGRCTESSPKLCCPWLPSLLQKDTVVNWLVNIEANALTTKTKFKR